MFFLHHKTTKPKLRWSAVLYAVLVVVFSLLTFYIPILGLVGTGSLLVLAGIIVEMNADRVWQESTKWHKKNRKNVPWWNRPTPFFYALNVYVLWPLIILMGITDFVLAYKLVGIVH